MVWLNGGNPVFETNVTISKFMFLQNQNGISANHAFPAQWRETQTLASEVSNVKMKLRFLNPWARLGLELIAFSTPQKKLVSKNSGIQVWEVPGKNYINELPPRVSQPFSVFFWPFRQGLHEKETVSGKLQVFHSPLQKKNLRLT